jgi:hypothetical protein
MAVTAQNSTEYAVQIAGDGSRNHATLQGGKKRIAVFHHVQSGAGDVGSYANLCKLPAGVVRVLGVHLNSEALGAARTMDFGHAGYTGMDGVAVAADEAAFYAAKDVSSAVDAFIRFGGASAAGVEIQSKDGFIVQAQVEGDTFPDTKKVNGWIEYVVE